MRDCNNDLTVERLRELLDYVRAASSDGKYPQGGGLERALLLAVIPPEDIGAS